MPQYACRDCENLKILILPSTLEKIGSSAFYGCTSLESILLNKDCIIYDSSNTLSSNTKIISHNNSNAKAYAEKYNRQFVSICDDFYEDTIISPTFDIEGYTHHKCSVCGYEYDDNYVDKLVKPEEPEGLVFNVDTNGAINLSWTSDSINSFNVYINGTLVKNSTAENIVLEEELFEEPGEYTIEVAAVNSDNIESDKVSVVYVKGDDVETSTNVTTTNSQTTTQENTTQTTTAKPTTVQPTTNMNLSTDATTNVTTTNAITSQVSTLSPTTQAPTDIVTTVEVVTNKETSGAIKEPTRSVSPTQKPTRVVLVNKYKTKIKKLKAKKRALKITWKKVKMVNGYQIQYSLKKKFKKAKKITIKKAKIKSKTIKRLKSNKKYYVRIRTYCLFDGFKIYSKWSKVKSKKTK